MNATKDRKRKIRKKMKNKKTNRKTHIVYYIVTESVAFMPCAKAKAPPPKKKTKIT